MTLHPRYDGTARLPEGGVPLAVGAHAVDWSCRLDLHGIGTLRIDPGARTGRDPDALQRAAATLRARLGDCGAGTLALARALLSEADRLDVALRGTDALLAQLDPEGLEARQAQHAQADAGAGPGEDPAPLEAAPARAVATEEALRDAARGAQSAFAAASDLRAGRRATRVSAERAIRPPPPRPETPPI